METASKQEIVFKDMFERIAEREDVKRLTKELSVDYRMVRLTAGMHLQWEMQKGTRANNGLRWFETIDEWTTMYLLARACDIVIYGTTTADTTFPQPALPGVGALTISEVVSTLVATLRNAEEREEKKLQAEWFSSVSQFAEREYKRGRREREQTSWDRGEYVDAGRLPYLISTANFPEDMLRALQTACRKELLEGEERQQGEHLLIALEDFLKFMDLLARAENHVKAQTAQWVEIEVNSRSIGDMADEMAQELGRLSKRTAYVKVMQVGDEEGDIVQKNADAGSSSVAARTNRSVAIWIEPQIGG